MSKCSETTLIITAPVKDKIDQSLVKIFKNKNFKVFVEEQKKAKATIYDVIDIFKEKNIKLSQEQAEIMLSKCLNNLSMVLHESEKAIDIISELDKDIKIGLKSIDNAVLSAITSADKL